MRRIDRVTVKGSIEPIGIILLNYYPTQIYIKNNIDMYTCDLDFNNLVKKL